MKIDKNSLVSSGMFSKPDEYTLNHGNSDNVKKEINGNLNRIRYEINTTMEFPKDPMKKILLFINYINNRIFKLKMKSPYRNSKIVESYFELNNLDINKRTYKECWIDISGIKSSKLDINFLELMFKNSLDNLLIDHAKQFELLGIGSLDIAKMFGLPISTPNVKEPDIKAIFKALEKINKLVTLHNKVSGYLKEKRKEQYDTKNPILAK